MNEENKNAYSEVIEILKLVDDEKKLEALPIEMLEVLKSKANPEYKPVISKEIPLDEQKLEPETYSILSWIAMKYWNEEAEESQEELNKEKIEEEQPKVEEITEEKQQEEKDITEENNLNEETKLNSEEQSLLPTIHKDLKWYEIIKNKIIELFKKLFKHNTTND